MQKHDQAYLACKFRRKYVCDNDMQYSIAREGILILYYSKYVTKSILRTTTCSEKNARAKNLFWDTKEQP